MARAERAGVRVGSSFELEGFWYEPETSATPAAKGTVDVAGASTDESKDQRLAHGTLTYTPEDGATLIVVDLHPGPPGLGEHPWRMDALHGHTLSGQPLTVFDLTLRDRSGQLFGGHAREIWRSNTLVYGTHLLSLDQLELERVSVEISGLREWISENIYDYNPGVDDDSDENGRWRRFLDALRRAREQLRSLFRTRFARDEDLSDSRSRTETIELSPAATLQLRLAESGTSTRFSNTKEVEGVAFFEIGPAVELQAFEEAYAQPLLDLLALGTKSTAQIEDIVVHVREVLEPWWGPEKPMPRSREIKVVHRRHGPPADAPRGRLGRMLLPLAAMKQNDYVTLRRWFAFRRQLAGVGNLFFATVNGRVVYLENRVHNLLAVAEGLHRALFDARPVDDETHRSSLEQMMAALPTKELRNHYRGKLKFAYEQTQRQRIGELFERAARVLPQAEDWRSRHLHGLIETRNFLNHQGEKSDDVLEDSRLWLATIRLQIVLEICLLQALEIDAEQIENGIWRAYGQHPALTDGARVNGTG